MMMKPLWKGKEYYGAVSHLGKNVLKVKKKYRRTVLLKVKVYPPGCDFLDIFTFGRHRDNNFVIGVPKDGDKKKFKTWISKFHFSIVGNPDTFEVRVINGLYQSPGEVVSPTNSIFQYKYDSDPMWHQLEPSGSILLKDRTLMRIRGGIFIFNSEVPRDNLDTYWAFAFSNNSEDYRYKLDNCEHRFPLEAATFWSNISLPFRDDFGGAACPVCLRKLQGYPGYALMED